MNNSELSAVNHLEVLTTHNADIIKLTIRLLYGIKEGIIKIPENETVSNFPLNVDKILLAACMHLNNTAAFRYLLATNVKNIYSKIESFQWDKYRYVFNLFSQVKENNILFDKSDMELFELIDNYKYDWSGFRNLHLHLIDSKDYAYWACNDSPNKNYKTNPYIGKAKIDTRHLILSILGECACCIPEPTDAAKKLAGEDAYQLYTNLRWLEKFPKELEFTKNHLLNIAHTEDGFKVSLLIKNADFTHFNQISKDYLSESSLYLNCKSPLFLESELIEFEKIINEKPTKREIFMQKFLENHSNFLRVLGFEGFSPQVHLIPQNQDTQKLSSLSVDFLAKNVGDNSSSIIELKRSINNLVLGNQSRKRLSHKLSSALTQLEEYHSFFDDKANRLWFEHKYGEKIFKPELYLLIGDVNLRTLGIKSLLNTPILNLPVRVISYNDIIDRIRTQHIVLPTTGYNLE